MKSAAASLVLIFGPRITLLDHKVTIGLDFGPIYHYLFLFQLLQQTTIPKQHRRLGRQEWQLPLLYDKLG